MISKKTRFYLFSATLLFFAACETDVIETTAEEGIQSNDIESVGEIDVQQGFDIVDNSSLNESTKLLYLDYLKSIGFMNAEIILEEDELLVNGDMIYSYADIKTDLNTADPIAPQRVHNAVYRSVFNTPITYYIHPSITNGAAPLNLWDNAFVAATQRWEAIAGTDIRFQRVNSPIGAAMRFQTTTRDDGLAFAYPPPARRNRVGSLITVSTPSLNNGRAQNTRIAALMHEIGHTFGFRHTDLRNNNGINGSLVSCTTDRDDASIMRSVVQRNPVFTPRDRIAILGLFRTTNPVITHFNGTKNVGQEGRLRVSWNRNRVSSSRVRVRISVGLNEIPALTYITNNDGYDLRLRPIDFHNARVPGYINRDEYFFDCVQVRIDNADTGAFVDQTGPYTWKFKQLGGGGSDPKPPRDYR